ncbi:methionine biosynthesis protein MetW [Candidatus Margulisiibacteriota bacterium]
MSNSVERLYRFVEDLIPEGSCLLDLGCGDGSLLELLVKEKKVKGTGIDISGTDLNKAMAKGLSVIQANIDKGLQDYKSNSFDYVVLSYTLQELLKPALVVNEMLRVSKRAIVTFPNFGHWYIRFSLLLTGRMPKSKILPYEWHNTPNIHLLTIKDFKRFCRKRNIKVIQTYYFNSWSITLPSFLANLFATHSVFVIKK